MQNTIVCRCEEVKLGEIISSIESGATTLRAIKVVTRAGMGICQGRTCRPLIEDCLSKTIKQDSNDVQQLNFGNPIRPIRLSELANTRKG
ncbi:(2Fe-2S)-binding protein [Oceanobacillus halophilus]|uniref:(2Fe-2S)-binding protein n=1 Tax=Oceanobacillus halophilus TaxID=930130 RepID=UPI001F4E8845|nr:(2Fe-2S)-binding protein [Oceanobacillus halophilus]